MNPSQTSFIADNVGHIATYRGVAVLFMVFLAGCGKSTSADVSAIDPKPSQKPIAPVAKTEWKPDPEWLKNTKVERIYPYQLNFPLNSNVIHHFENVDKEGRMITKIEGTGSNSILFTLLYFVEPTIRADAEKNPNRAISHVTNRFISGLGFQKPDFNQIEQGSINGMGFSRSSWKCDKSNNTNEGNRTLFGCTYIAADGDRAVIMYYLIDSSNMENDLKAAENIAFSIMKKKSK